MLSFCDHQNLIKSTLALSLQLPATHSDAESKALSDVAKDKMRRLEDGLCGEFVFVCPHMAYLFIMFIPN